MRYGNFEQTISRGGEHMNKVTVGWGIGVAIVLLLIGLANYAGYGKHPDERTPDAVTQPQR
jgi:hypothetical protein